MQTVRLPDSLIADAKRLTGERSNTAAVRKLLERAIPAADEPLTSTQAKASRLRHLAAGVRLNVDPRLAALGIDEAELWGTG